MNIFRKFITFNLLALLLTLAACSGLTRSDKPAMKTWWLEPYASMSQGEASADAPSLNISVTVVPGLDTNRILTLSDEAALNYYSGARWAEHLPELVTSLSTRSLESSGHFDVVSVRPGGGGESCDLHLEIQEFFANLDSSGQTSGVSVAILGRYQCESAEAVPLSLQASIPVHDQRMNLIVSAFQQAMDRVMKNLLESLPGNERA